MGEPAALTPVGEPSAQPLVVTTPHLSPVGEGPDGGKEEAPPNHKRIILREVENPMHLPPAFGPEEDVKLDPRVYQYACKRLLINPQIDLFASEKHHQIANYLTVDNTDELATGTNAFNFIWDPKWVYYANPPWTLIGRVLKKAWKDGAKILLVTPEFKKGSWKEILVKMTIQFFQWEEPLYLDEQGKLRPKPKWTTRFSVIQNPAFRTVRVSSTSFQGPVPPLGEREG